MIDMLTGLRSLSQRVKEISEKYKDKDLSEVRKDIEEELNLATEECLGYDMMKNFKVIENPPGHITLLFDPPKEMPILQFKYVLPDDRG